MRGFKWTYKWREGGDYNQTKKALQNKLHRTTDQNTFLLAFLGLKTSYKIDFISIRTGGDAYIRGLIAGYIVVSGSDIILFQFLKTFDTVSYQHLKTFGPCGNPFMIGVCTK